MGQTKPSNKLAELLRGFQQKTKRRFSQRTMHGYTEDVRFFATNMGTEDLLSVSKKDTERYVDWLERLEYAPTTIRRKVMALNAFYGYLVRAGWLEGNPVEGIELPKVRNLRKPVFLEEYEVRKILACLAATSHLKGQSPADIIRKMWKLVLLILIYCGVRVSELVNIRLEDFVSLNSEDPYLEIIEGKGGKNREVPLHPAVRKALKKWLEVRPHTKHNYCFINARTKEPVAVRWVQRLVRRIARQAGITKNVTPHSLRHTFATLLLRKGADLADIKDILGHSSIKTTSIYLHSSTRRLQEVVGRLDLFDSEER
jgi:site-specific recombinase XerD